MMRPAGDVIKPDISAPGIQILAGYTPYPDAGEVPGEGVGHSAAE